MMHQIIIKFCKSNTRIKGLENNWGGAEPVLDGMIRKAPSDMCYWTRTLNANQL